MMRNDVSSSIRTPLRSKSFSPYRSLRKHATEKYGKAVTGFSLDTSADLETNYRTMRNLENEYIKSLQQQIYLLELENNYIRHQAAEVMDKQPLMVCEASNSLKKLKEMQERTDGLKLEIHRKEAHISILQQKLNRCEESLRETLLYRDKEKDELTRQCMTLRGERELALREVYQKDEQIKELQYQLCNQKSNITAMEIQLDILRAKLDDETKRANDLERSLIESRSQLVEFNTILKQLEVHYQQELNRVQSTPQNEFKIAEQKIKIDRLEREKTKPLNNDSWKNKHTNGNDDIQLLLGEESLSPVNINKANTSPTSRKPVDEAIIKAVQRPRK
ncbi:unnamed protein product [Schistosoma guineensis]|nr:unnamed protein product [Schistosoma guineensis]